MSENEFKRQFIISDNEEVLPQGWVRLRCGRWRFSFHSSLPMSEVYEKSAGVHAGFMLGYPVSPGGQLVESRIMLPTRESDKVLHHDLYRYSGSWACILRAEGDWRLYGDPLHSVPIVYHTDLNIVASSTGLIPDQYRSKDQALVEALNIPKEDNWYPFGLTPYHECQRLLPNHYLRLSTTEAVRHWPCSGTFENQDEDKSKSTLIENLSRNISAFARNGRPYLSLTAGRDSRVLLACSRDVKDSITSHTIQIPDEGARVDFQVAQYISSKYGLEHEGQLRRSPSEADLEKWLDRTGYCAAGATWRIVTTLKRLDASRVRFEGIGGEIGRATATMTTEPRA